MAQIFNDSLVVDENLLTVGGENAPVIDTRTSVLAFEDGERVNFVPAASPAPQNWMVRGLPDGLSFDRQTGQISGVATHGGVYEVAFTAERAVNEVDGNGDPVQHVYRSEDLIVVLGIECPNEEGLVKGDDITVEIDFDLITGAVTIPAAPNFLSGGNSVAMEGTEAAATSNQQTTSTDGNADAGLTPMASPPDLLPQAILLAKRGDRFPVAIGFRRLGILQDLPISTLKIGSKEFEPELLYPISEGPFVKLDTRRYKTILFVDPERFTGLLANYEEDEGTWYDALVEIEFTLDAGGRVHSLERTESFTLKGGDKKEYLIPLNLPQIAGAQEYEIGLDLDFTGTSHDISTAIPLTASYENGAFTYTFDSYQQLKGQGNTDWGVILKADLSGNNLKVTAQAQDITTTTLVLDFAYHTFESLDISGNNDAVQTGAQDTETFTITGSSETFKIGGSGASEVGDISEFLLYLEAAVRRASSSITGSWPSPQITKVLLTRQRLEVIWNTDLGLTSVTSSSGRSFDFSVKEGGLIRSGSVDVSVTGQEPTPSNILRRTSQTFVLRIERDLQPELEDDD